MRIIAGEFKGRRLLSPPGLKVRPTSDRARETLFSVLGESVRGAPFLDLFGGTGAVGLEALSRGAERSVFVEKDRRTATVLLKNIQRLGAEERCLLVTADWLAGCRKLKASGEAFGVVFADPPYGSGLAEICLSSPEAGAILLPDGFLVVETRRGGEMPAPEGLIFVREVVSGEATFYIYRKGELT